MQLFKLIIFLLLLLIAASCVSSDLNGFPSDCLKVPTATFVSSLQTTIGVIQHATPIISQFANLFGDFRLKNAVSDCLDLLDFSIDELNWSASASENPNGNISFWYRYMNEYYNGIGDCNNLSVFNIIFEVNLKQSS